MQDLKLSKKRIGFILFSLTLTVLLGALDTTIVGTYGRKLIFFIGVIVFLVGIKACAYGAFMTKYSSYDRIKRIIF